MALVAYDYDSNSDNEEDIEENSNNIPNITYNTKLNDFFTKDNSDNKEGIVRKESTNEKNNIFSKLPESKSPAIKIVEDQIEDFIPKPPVKKEKQKVKITIPSLSQFADIIDEPESKKIKPLFKGSGLISLLPPVKGVVKTATSFVPKVIADKSKTTNNSLIPNQIRKNSEAKKSSVLWKAKQKTKITLSDAESDDDIEMPETFDDEMWEKVCGRPKNKPVIHEPEPEPQEIQLNIAPEPEKPYDGLDNKAFKELVGKSKRPIGNIRLIDINEEEILLDKDIWMAKSLTDPELAPKPVIEDPVDPTRRKKHHITYLAQQAKANEQDLKTQWAVNKNNKLASRSKYGF